MKVIIAGQRAKEIPETEENYQAVVKAIKLSGLEITQFVCGMCNGIDNLAYRWAKENNIPLLNRNDTEEGFPAFWTKYGPSAGPKRNKEMAAVAEALIAIKKNAWILSKGTNNMILEAKKKGLKVLVFYLDDLLKEEDKHD